MEKSRGVHGWQGGGRWRLHRSKVGVYVRELNTEARPCIELRGWGGGVKFHIGMKVMWRWWGGGGVNEQGL